MLPRNYEREFGASPLFRLSNSGTLASGAFYTYNFEVSAAASVKYLPFNFLVITNNDTANDLLLYVDGSADATALIAASTSRKFDYESLPAFRAVNIKNNGTTTIAANKIEIIAQRVPIQTQEVVQDVHQRVYAKKVGKWGGITRY